MRSVWPSIPLGEVLTLQRRWLKPEPMTDYIEIGVRSYGRGIFHKSPVSGASLGDKRVLRIEPGDLVFMNVFAWEGAVAVAGPDVKGTIGSHRFATYTPDNDRADVRFLNLYFQTRDGRELLGRISPGSALRNRTMNLAEFSIQTIPLPTIGEQRRIVARIESLSAKIAEARQLSAQSKLATDAMLPVAVAEVFAALLSHKTQPIANAVRFERGKFTHRPRNEQRFFGGGHPWIQIGEIESSQKRIRKWTTTLNDDGLKISRKFARETVLISIAATIGAVGILDFDCCIPDSIVAATPINGSTSDFLYYYLTHLRTHLESVAPQTAQKNINLGILSELPYPVVPTDQQRRVVAYLDSLSAKAESLKCHQQQTASELEALLPSLLDRAFAGQL